MKEKTKGKMKVVFVTHYLSDSVGYGLSRYALSLYNALRRMGVEVSPVHLPHRFASPLKHAVDFSILLPLKALLRRDDADVYHLCLHQIGHAAPLLKKLRGKKVVTTIADLHAISDKHAGGAFLSNAFRLAISHSDVLIAISSQTKKDILANFNIDERKVVVAPLGIGRRFRPLKKRKGAAFTVGYVGGFAPHKNVEALIRAFALFQKKEPSVRLVLYGRGARQAACMELAARLGLRNTEFRGFADEKALVGIYNSFDLFVFPSSSEGFGLPILEAQKCHVPAMVLGGAKIPEEVSRYCLKADDEADMARLMEKVRAKGFRFSREHVRHLAQFTWENCAKKTLGAYGQALES